MLLEQTAFRVETGGPGRLKRVMSTPCGRLIDVQWTVLNTSDILLFVGMLPSSGQPSIEVCPWDLRADDDPQIAEASA